MLVSLYIKGLAVIDELSINLSPGLNVITGETGAGKSILIKALSLLLGHKASSDVIRIGEQSAIVSSVFRLQQGHPAIEALLASGIDIDALEDIIIKRKVSHKSRSQAWINGEPIALGTLKSIGEKMVDIFGQHDNHRLLDASTHCYYLDSFLGADPALEDYAQKYRDFVHGFKELDSSISLFRAKDADRDYFEFRKAELDRFEPTEEDMFQHESFLEASSSQIKKYKCIKEAQAVLDEGFKGRNLASALTQVSTELSNDITLSTFEEKAKQVEESLNELSFDLGMELSRVEVSDRQVELSKSRVSSYRDLIAKMGVKSVKALCEAHSDLSNTIRYLDSAEAEIEDLCNKLCLLSEELVLAGERLRVSRRTSFQQIRKMIRSELSQLNMSGADLSLEEIPHELKSVSTINAGLCNSSIEGKIKALNKVRQSCTTTGLDKVQFLLRSNPGDLFHPLHKIASGGEVSRIMLGMKKVLSEGAKTCVMVFDEIDTGISGHTANKVGQKLYQISCQFQVLCISHLPQVAVYADRHFRIYKEATKHTVESTVAQMSESESLEEIARLLSSGEVTKSSLENARQLLSERNSLVNFSH